MSSGRLVWTFFMDSLSSWAPNVPLSLSLSRLSLYILNPYTTLEACRRISEFGGLWAKPYEAVSMGWVWRDDEPDEFGSYAGGIIPGDNCSIRKDVMLKCRTEEVEPGKFIKKCEKTEQVLRDCIGKPVEVVMSNKEYTEDDVTDEVLKGSVSFNTSGNGAFDFPGLRSDVEAMTRGFFNSLNRVFEEAEEMKNGFFNVFGAPRVFDGESSSPPSMRRGIPVEDHHPREDSTPKRTEPDSGQVDLSGLAKDV